MALVLWHIMKQHNNEGIRTPAPSRGSMGASKVYGFGGWCRALL